MLKRDYMRLKKSRNSAEEEIISLQNEGYKILNWLKLDYNEKIQAKTFNSAVDHQRYKDSVNEWGWRVNNILSSIFPTELEANQFLHPQSTFGAVAAATDDDYKATSLRLRLDDLLRGLDDIRKNSLLRYTDLPMKTRLYIEDIDSFAKVRDVNPDMITHLLQPNGYLNISEDVVQTGLEKILSEPFHKKDWSGEYNDLYTTNIIVNGARRATAFLLKGNGLRSKTMEISDCGKNGDQLVRLFESPAELFIVQFVGNISEAIIKDVEGKVQQQRAKSKQSCYCIINGQNTARLLQAYTLL
jgi:hypothetical protein